MRYQIITFPNELLENKKIYKANIPSWLKFYFSKWNISPTKYACVAYDKGNIVGLMRFNVENGYLRSKVTLVKKDYRNKNIATKMWTKVMKTFSPNKILVFPATQKGKKFVDKISKKYPKIDWKIECIF